MPLKYTILIFLAVLLLMISTAYADNITFKYGLGMDATFQKAPSDVKYISFGYEQDLTFIFRAKYDVGYWNDIGTDHIVGPDTLARNSSAFVSASVGIRVQPHWIYVENYWGISYLPNPDSQLGLPFEFTEELGIGVMDQEGKSIGIEWRHFSNAGLSKENKGRDFFLINVGVPL